MKKIILLTAALLFSTALFAKNSSSVEIVSVKGTVKIIDGKTVKPALKGAKLTATAVIKTYGNGKAVLKLANGKTKTIANNRTVKVASLSSKQKSSGYFSAVMKLARKDSYALQGPSGVAGVRGAEQGKAEFTPTFTGVDSNEQEENIATAELEQAAKLFESQEYETCIKKLTSFMSKEAEADDTAKAADMLSTACIEMAQYDQALEAAQKGLASVKDSAVKESLSYNKALATFLKGQAADAIKIIDDTWKEKSDSETYWKAQALKLFCLAETGNTKKAKKLKKNITVNCTFESVLQTVSDLSL